MMGRWAVRQWRMLALAAAALGLAGIAGVLLVAWSGIYNVAADVSHTKAVEWFLRFGMENSVKARAAARNEPVTYTRDMIALGAAHYRDGCSICHGAPGSAQPVIAGQMLPPPPQLRMVSERWRDHELHWIVLHGLKYTGMPAWPSQQRPDEVWALVAFLKALSNMTAEDYRRMAFGAPLPSGAPGAVALCSRCHGDAATTPASALTPIIHGQPHEMIVTALRDYATGRRQSGMMQPIAADLDERQIDELAAYYTALTPPRSSQSKADNDSGRTLAHDGIAAERIPPCLSCHGATAALSYPRLAGQSAAYLANQLRLWRTHDVRASPQAAIMAPIARRLSERQIDDVAAYLASLPPETLPGRRR